MILPNLIDLSEERAVRDGKVTPLQALSDLHAQADRFESIVVTAKTHDGVTETYMSTMPKVEAVGLLELAKFDVMFADSDGETE